MASHAEENRFAELMDEIHSLQSRIHTCLRACGERPRTELSLEFEQVLQETLQNLVDWEEDCRENPRGFHTSPASTAFALQCIDQSFRSLEALSEELSNEEPSEGRFRELTREYDVAIHCLTSPKTPPLDVLKPPNDKNAVAFEAPVKDDRSPDKDVSKPAITDHLIFENKAVDTLESHEEYDSYIELDDDAEPIRWSSDAHKELIQDADVLQHEAPMPHVQKLLDISERAVNALHSIQLDPSRAKVALSNNSCADDFLDAWRDSISPDQIKATAVSRRCLGHLQRLHRGVARISAGSLRRETPAPGDILWGVYSLIISMAASLPERQFETIVQFLDKLASSFPVMNQYADLCGPMENFEISEHVVTFFSNVIKLGLELITFIHECDQKVPVSRLPTDTSSASKLQALFDSISEDRRQLDKYATKEWLLVTEQRDAHFEIQGTKSTDNIPYRAEPINDAPTPLLTKHFKGRRKELHKIVDALYSDSGIYTGRCVLFGPNDFGKTQTVLRYASSVTSASPDINVLWITASSKDKVRRSFEHVLALLKADARASRRHQARMLAVKEFLERLGQEENRYWLLIIDDLRKGVWQFLSKYLPMKDPRGRMIFTTSSVEAVEDLRSEEGPPLTEINMEAMPVDDAAEILLSSTHLKRTEENMDWCKEVAESLKCLPAAVKHVGAVQKRFTNQYDVSVMCNREWSHIKMLYSSSGNNQPVVANVFPWIMDHLKAKVPTVHTLIRVLALFDPESIPFGPMVDTNTWDEDPVPPGSDPSLAHLGDTEDHDPPKEVSTDPLSYEEVINQADISLSSSVKDVLHTLFTPDTRDILLNQLLESSLVVKRTNIAHVTLRLPENVRNIILQDITEERTLKEYFDCAVILLTRALSRIPDRLGSAKAWRRCAILAPHFTALLALQNEKQLGNDIRFATEFAKMGEYFHSSGQYPAAVSCFEWTRSVLSGKSRDSVSEKLGKVYLKQDSFPAAEKIFAEILGYRDGQAIYLTQHNLNTAEGLALSYYLQGKLRDAEALFVRILEMLEKQSSIDEYLIAKVHEGLGITYQRLGEPEKAGLHYRKCREYRENMPGEHQLSLLRISYNQARLLRDLGNLSDAEKVLDSILEEYDRTVGRNHPDALLVAGRLAFTLAKQGKYVAAEKLARKTLGMQLQQEEIQEAAVAYSHWVLAGIYTRQEKYVRASAYFRLALSGYEEKLGRTHLFTLYLRRDYSHMFQLQSKLDAAADILQELDNDIFGTIAATKLARIYDWQAARIDRNDSPEWQKLIFQAEKLAKDTLDVQKRSLGDLHPDTNYTLWVLARIYWRQGKRDLADENYKHALKGYRRISGQVYDSPTWLEKEYADFSAGSSPPAAPISKMPSDAFFSSPESPFLVFDAGVDEYYKGKEDIDSTLSSENRREGASIDSLFARVMQHSGKVMKTLCIIPRKPMELRVTT